MLTNSRVLIDVEEFSTLRTLMTSREMETHCTLHGDTLGLHCFSYVLSELIEETRPYLYHASFTSYCATRRTSISLHPVCTFGLLHDLRQAFREATELSPDPSLNDILPHLVSLCRLCE